MTVSTGASRQPHLQVDPLLLEVLVEKLGLANHRQRWSNAREAASTFHVDLVDNHPLWGRMVLLAGRFMLLDVGWVS